MKNEWSKVKEYEATALELLEPELWEKLSETRTPSGVQEAYDLFVANTTPEGFYESFKGGEGWCEIVPIRGKRFAVYGDGSVGSSPLYVISREEVQL